MGDVLVVDDDADVRRLVCAELERAGYRAGAAASGSDGLAMAASGGYDALVVDQMLPDLTGLALLRALTRAGVRVPVVFITGHGADQFRDAAVTLGAVECLDKPIRPAGIVEAVVRAIAADLSRPGGAPLFPSVSGTPTLLLAALTRALASASTSRAELSRRLARTAADSRLSLLEFVATGGVMRRVMGTSEDILDATVLLMLAADVRARVAPVPTVPALTAFLDLLDREPSTSHDSATDLAARLGVRLIDLEHACAPLGMTIARCRAVYQMRHVVRLFLETPDEHVKQITYQVGYEHPPSLTRAFRDYFGCGPREFRAMLHAPALF
jgi:DNA-binding response OmpR family regulator